MDPLPHPDNLHFDAVQGWLMLGDKASAKEELAQLTPATRAQPDVLELEWSLHADAQDWAAAFAAAQRLVDVDPGGPLGWVHRAYALRRMPGGSLPKAWDALRPALDRFAGNYLIAFNLACYACQLERLEEAWELLTRALKWGRRKEVLAMALGDADLKPLWPRLQKKPLK